MRILYGVTGEGMGHATRSKVVCEHLVAAGHKVKIVVSGRAHGFLAKSFADVVEIKGLTIRYVDNAMDRDGSLARNVLAAPGMLLRNVDAYYESVLSFRPDVVISDFDSFAHLFAKRHGLPILSIDNQAIIYRCKHDKAIKKDAKVDYQLTKAFVKAKLAGCDHYIITTFFYPPIRKKYEGTTTLVPPILRKPILDAKKGAKLGDHVLVYQTSASDKRLVPTLNKVKDQRFVVYGLKRQDVAHGRKHGDDVEGNCTVKDFSELGFVRDLATARAVVANGGLSLVGEALYLGKPIYSVPVRHQFEQLMNARYVEELGYGLAVDTIDAEVLRLFLGEARKYAARVARHKQDGNAALLAAVDRALHRLARHARKVKSHASVQA
jgi:uncharacterized protein (TIGR00661 family)